jgi:RTX calcium-binding nonapeptide repeat (4 copies)
MGRSHIAHAVAVLLVAAGLLLTLGCAAASPAGRLVVLGAESSSHLRLSIEGGDLVVDGYMAPEQPASCRTHGRSSAVCPLAGIEAVEVDMGPASDKVEVLDPLPVPLTARLGAGSDKFIGNSEPDTCYPEGTISNGCFGGGGNDLCVTGPKNTECFGGPGNDLCKAGPGSDGCWGGPGNDVCYMGAGEDGCHGGPGNDRLYGGPGADQLYGGRGFDYCDGGPGVGRSHGCEAGPGH